MGKRKERCGSTVNLFVCPDWSGPWLSRDIFWRLGLAKSKVVSGRKFKEERSVGSTGDEHRGQGRVPPMFCSRTGGESGRIDVDRGKRGSDA